MPDSTMFGVSIFAGGSKRLKFVEDKVFEALDRCGVYPADIRVEIYTLNKNQYGARVHVLRNDYALWTYGRDVERYAVQRISQHYKFKLEWIVFNCAEEFVFYKRPVITSSVEIHRAIARERQKIHSRGRSTAQNDDVASPPVVVNSLEVSTAIGRTMEHLAILRNERGLGLGGRDSERGNVVDSCVSSGLSVVDAEVGSSASRQKSIISAACSSGAKSSAGHQ